MHPVRTSPPAATDRGCHSVGDLSAAAFGDRPPDSVREGPEQQAETARDRAIEGDHAVHRDAGEQRPRLGGRKCPAMAEAERTPLSAKPAGTSGCGGTARIDDRTASTITFSWRTIGPKSRRYRDTSRPRDAAVSSTEAPATTARSPPSGWANAELGLEQSHTAGGEVETTEERRRHRERMGGGADVVQEPRKGQLLGAAASAGGRSTLQHDDPETCGRKDDRPARPFGPEPTTRASASSLTLATTGWRSSVDSEAAP